MTCGIPIVYIYMILSEVITDNINIIKIIIIPQQLYLVVTTS